MEASGICETIFDFMGQGIPVQATATNSHVFPADTLNVREETVSSFIGDSTLQSSLVQKEGTGVSSHERDECGRDVQNKKLEKERMILALVGNKVRALVIGESERFE